MAATIPVQLDRPTPTTASRRSDWSQPSAKTKADPEAARDLDLIHRVATGDAGAFAALYVRYAPTVYATVFRVLRDAEAAEDLRQETFVRLWRQAGRFRADRGALAAWLHRIARNLAFDELRRQRSRPLRATDDQAVLLDHAVDPRQDVERLVLVRMRGEAALAAMDRLPRSQRRAVELAYVRGLTHREVAEVLGEPLGTVKSRISLGAAKLRAELDASDTGRSPPSVPLGVIAD